MLFVEEDHLGAITRGIGESGLKIVTYICWNTTTIFRVMESDLYMSTL